MRARTPKTLSREFAISTIQNSSWTSVNPAVLLRRTAAIRGRPSRRSKRRRNARAPLTPKALVMAFTPQSIPCPDRRLIVLVHGVGSYTKASYNPLIDALQTALGTTAWKKIAVYTTLYDVFNDWTAEKTQCAALVTELIARLKFHFDSDALGKAAAE